MTKNMNHLEKTLLKLVRDMNNVKKIYKDLKNNLLKKQVNTSFKIKRLQIKIKLKKSKQLIRNKLIKTKSNSIISRN